MRAFFFVMVAVMVVGCDDGILDPPSTDDDIREIVLRDMFLHNGSGYAPDYFVPRDTSIWGYYIDFRPAVDSMHHPIGDRIDPQNAFLSRFSDVFPPVQKGSLCTGYKNIFGVTDTATGKAGLLFFVAGPVNRLSSTEVVLDAGWYYNGLNAGDYTFRLRKERSRWVIYSGYMNWIS